MNQAMFEQAQPIWLKGLSEEMNLSLGLRTVFHAQRGGCLLRITGATVYRIWLNGKFVGHGPARCGHGYYRVDAWRLPVIKGQNLLAIEVAGYNANSYAYLDQPSFVQAELVRGTKTIAATGGKGFKVIRLHGRVREVQRYSFQRTFVEAYKRSPKSADWYTRLDDTSKPAKIETLKPRRLVERGVPYPAFETRQPVALTASGVVRPMRNPKLRNGREYSPKPDYKAFPVEDTLYPGHEIEALSSRINSTKVHPYQPRSQLSLKANQFKVFDFGTNLTGFIALRVVCRRSVDLYLVFDELATEHGDVSITRYGCANVVKYSLKPGCYDLESIEPYTLKYLKVLALNGGCQVTGLYLREYACPDSHRGRFSASDHRLNDLFEAARQTFRQNAVDIFMDCPGRERAGWLCDSFFTDRAERDLCGENPIERNFLENYLLPTKFPHLPKGMLPMCYPSNHTNGNFIPNWAMWFVIEMEEYLARTGDRELVDALKPKVYGLIEYIKPFLNPDGLLERLEKWVFLEWSRSNNFTQDVSYPSNMVYAGMLDAAGNLYGDQSLKRQAGKVRRTVRAQSFDGEFFVDNAVRQEDGTLEVTRNRTETCQYYAFFFNVATPDSHPKLWKMIREDFGPERDPAQHYPQIAPSNAFIGFFLRLDVLSRYGERALILDQLYRQYLPMAQTTGTLWEYKDPCASCNHGFAAHVAHILYRDILGIRVDPSSKTVTFKAPPIDLDWCEGHLPVGNEWIDAKWVRHNGQLSYTLAVPEGFTAIVDMS